MRKETFEALMKRQLEIYDKAVGRAKEEVETGEGTKGKVTQELLDAAEHLGRVGLAGISIYGGHKIFEDAPDGRKSMVEKLCELRSVVKGKHENSLMTKMVYKALGIGDMPVAKAVGKLRDDAAKALEKAEPVFTQVERYGQMLEKYADSKRMNVTEAASNPTAELYAALNTFETEEDHEKFLKDYEDVLKYAAIEVVLHDGSEVALRFDKDHFYFLLSLAKASSSEELFSGGGDKVKKRAEDIDSVYQQLKNAKEQLNPIEALVTKTIDYAMKEHRNTLQLRKEYPRESRIKLKELYA